MSCSDCNNARESSGYATFDPKCLWCGARYLQSLATFPGRRMEDGFGEPRRETRGERAAWKLDVLDTWARYGHSKSELQTLANGKAVPYEPATREAKGRRA